MKIGVLALQGDFEAHSQTLGRTRCRARRDALREPTARSPGPGPARRRELDQHHPARAGGTLGRLARIRPPEADPGHLRRRDPAGEPRLEPPAAVAGRGGHVDRAERLRPPGGQFDPHHRAGTRIRRAHRERLARSCLHPRSDHPFDRPARPAPAARRGRADPGSSRACTSPPRSIRSLRPTRACTSCSSTRCARPKAASRPGPSWYDTCACHC